MFSKLIEEKKFFEPKAPLTIKLIKAIEAERNADLARVRQDKRQVELDEDEMPAEFEGETSGPRDWNEEMQFEHEVVLAQQRIAEELYNHLAFQAGSPQAKKGAAISIKNSVILGMSASLGLSENNALLAQLADQFRGWLHERGEFIAGWGKVILANQDQMYLEEFQAPQPEVKPVKRVQIPRPSVSTVKH